MVITREDANKELSPGPDVLSLPSSRGLCHVYCSFVSSTKRLFGPLNLSFGLKNLTTLEWNASEKDAVDAVRQLSGLTVEMAFT